MHEVEKPIRTHATKEKGGRLAVGHKERKCKGVRCQKFGCVRRSQVEKSPAAESAKKFMGVVAKKSEVQKRGEVGE